MLFFPIKPTATTILTTILLYSTRTKTSLVTAALITKNPQQQTTFFNRAKGAFFTTSTTTTTATRSTTPQMSIRESPSAERNKIPIGNIITTHILPTLLPPAPPPPQRKNLNILEVACGCGVHTFHITNDILQWITTTTPSEETNLQWLPTDPSEEARESVAARWAICTDGSLKRSIAPPQPLTLDANGAMEDGWDDDTDKRFDLIVCINMIHISPWGATVGLMKIADRFLSEGGVLYCYGPYKVGGTAVESNLRFDQNLRAQNPSWGVRDLEEVTKLAEDYGLRLETTVEMPANNLSVIFRRSV